jgi:sugar lactone lactonase YvrE
VIRTIALTGEDNGIFASVGLNGALGLALDRAGNLYAANVGDGTIHRFSPTGADLGVFATVREPTALTFDSAGNLYVSDIFDNTIHKFCQAPLPASCRSVNSRLRARISAIWRR